jgi:hypothetical protein
LGGQPFSRNTGKALSPAAFSCATSSDVPGGSFGKPSKLRAVVQSRIIMFQHFATVIDGTRSNALSYVSKCQLSFQRELQRN